MSDDTEDDALASMGERLDDAESDARYWHAEWESVCRAAAILEKSSARHLRERTRAEAKIAQVEALADEWDRSSNPILHVAAGRLRAKLRVRAD